MNNHNFSYMGHEGERCEGVYCTRQIELPDRGLIQVFVLSQPDVTQTAILNKPVTTRSAFEAVLTDQSLSTNSEDFFVFVVFDPLQPEHLIQIKNEDFYRNGRGEISMTSRDAFSLDCTEPGLAKCLEDLLACIPVDRSD